MSKILLIGDVHLGLGYPNNVDKWFKVTQEYFEKFLLPLAKKEISNKDIIVLLGDLFDNRNVVPINILNYAQYMLEKLSEITETHLIIGNHDLYTKSTNDVNTVKLYKYIPNVFVYEEAKKIQFNNKNILMLPWVEKRKDQVEILKKYTGCDYLFCHSDLNGAKMHLNSVAHKNLDKINVEDFIGYKYVYSGHIHIQQVNKNFTFVGSIFEMDRNDINNQKGVYILDTNTEKERFIPNNISPNFKKIYILKEEHIDLLDDVSTKDYIDLYISNSLLVGNRKLRRKLEVILETGNFASVEYIDDINNENDDSDVKIDKIINENVDDDKESTHIKLEYKDLIRDYIISQNYDNNEKVKNGVLQEYNEIVKIYDNTYEK
jgi:predicted MPP superfamily phosphohydrolase